MPAMGNPPAYQDAWRTEFDKAVSLEQNYKRESLPCNLYLIRARPKDSEKWAPHGMIELGTKAPMGVVHNHVRYQPPPLDDDEGTQADWIDISQSVRTVDDQKEGDLHLQKLSDLVLSPWSFDIVITGFGKDSTFTGTFIGQDNVQTEWKGKFYTAANVDINVQQAADIPKPADLGPEGSIRSLMDITPYAYKDDGDIKAGSDAAQIYGDKMWQRIAMHTLNSDIRQKVMDSLEPLNYDEKILLKAHHDFFKRFAVHELAERFRKMQEVPGDIKKHIFYKRHWFMQAMTCYEKPRIGEDPVGMYGFRRNSVKDMATLKSLQDSYREIALTCYEAGYIKFCPEWQTYLKHPEYWYQVMANYLVSETHMSSWLAKLDPSRQSNKQYLPSHVDVMHWGNKLSLLKHALARTDAAAAAALDIEKVTHILNTAAINHYAYAQTLNEETAKHIQQLMTTMDQHAAVMAIKMDELVQSTKQVLANMKANLARTMIQISDQGNDFSRILSRDVRAHSPPSLSNLSKGTTRPLTFGQVLHVLDGYKAEQDWAKFENSISTMVSSTIEKEFEGSLGISHLFEGEKLTFKEYLKAKASEMKTSFKKSVKDISWWGKLLKGMLHGAAVGLLAYELFTEGGNMSKLGVWMSSLQIAAIGIEVVIARAGRWLFTNLYAFWDWGRNLSGKLVGWLSKTTVEAGTSRLGKLGFALGGNIYKLLRIVGFVCVVLAIINTNNDLDKAKMMSEKQAKAYGILNRIQYWLGILEATTIVLEIAFEAMGYTAMAGLCGTLGTVFAALAVIAFLVYMFAFAPKPWEWVETWLKTDGTLGGSYDAGKENTDETAPGPDADDGPELKGDYDTTKLPWPPSSSTANQRSPERIYADFSDSFQLWCCDMVLALVRIKKAFPDNTDAGRLAYQILNLPRKGFTQDQLHDHLAWWSSWGSRIAETVVSSGSETYWHLAKFLSRVLSAVPGLQFMLSCFGDFKWNCFTSSSGSGRTGGAGQDRGDWTWKFNDQDHGDDGDDGDDRPPWGWFWYKKPEDKLEKDKKLKEWYENIERFLGDLEELLNGLLDVHNQAMQPDQGGGPLVPYPALGQAALGLINDLLAATQQPLLGDLFHIIADWLGQIQRLLGIIPNDQAYNGFPGLFRLLIQRVIMLRLSGMLAGYQAPKSKQ